MEKVYIWGLEVFRDLAETASPNSESSSVSSLLFVASKFCSSSFEQGSKLILPILISHKISKMKCIIEKKTNKHEAASNTEQDKHSYKNQDPLKVKEG